MACDYESIRRDNERRYGTDIGRIGRMLLANRYDDRTHFIFELLQNAEDALARRGGWQGSRAVSFHLSEKALRVSHFGLPFDEPDVRGICGIAESTKELTAIGRFGIGFKSVYAFADRPEVHSGNEHFAIESFVWPVIAPKIEHDPNETVILIPLNAGNESSNGEIARGLGKLGASALLFLHQVEEIRWEVENGSSGLYLRQSKQIAPEVRRVTVIGQENEQPDVNEEWLIFSRVVTENGGRHVGHVEIAFSLAKDVDALRDSIQCVELSPLVVFFPTVLETYLGFLVQGPYRTTPSRDNVPPSDAWNQRLVTETASLLAESLCWLRDNDLLDTAGLQCLPLDPAKFKEPSMFAPLYDATKSALASESLLPRYDAGYIPAPWARLGRTQELRELFLPIQLSALYGEEDQLVWLSGDITQDRTPELRRYLMQELDIEEITPEDVIRQLDLQFLETQSDDWIVALYEFLNRQSGLRGRLLDLPLIRLENGSHVPPHLGGQPQVFLPGSIATGFPTVRAATCATEMAGEFLRSLGLMQADLIDDVVRNVLPKYQQNEVDIRDADYEADIIRILSAFATDSKMQREKLVGTLRDSRFVMSVNAGDGSKRLLMPGEVYLATERIKELFANIEGVFLVDDTYSCLRGDNSRELLEACGASRYLQPLSAASGLSSEERREIRRKAGLEHSTWAKPIIDMTLRGLDLLLADLSRLEPKVRRHKAALLWEALSDLENRRGSGVFSGKYTWGYSHQSKTATFDSAFVRKLNGTAWVPDKAGELRRAEFVNFDTLGWKTDPFLLSKIHFKPPLIDQLAKEAGVEPGVLDLLKKLGVTSVADLTARLRLAEEPKPTVAEPSPATVDEAVKSLLGDTAAPPMPVSDPNAQELARSGSDSGDAGRRVDAASGDERDHGGRARGEGDTMGRSRGSGSTGGERTTASLGGRPFVSYVAAHPNTEWPDPDGLDQTARMALEAKAIDLILSREATWLRTPTHNPGFDLFEAGPDGRATRWCEVKAMTGNLDDRPVGLSRAQFDCAHHHEENYWLYVVEHAGGENPRIVKIQDPAGKARTFTFDHGWLNIAELDSEERHRED